VKRVGRRLLWALIALALLLALARLFLFRVHRIDGRSMRPALESGERVVVLFGRQRLERFDMCVVLPAGQREPLVKRVAALGGESISIRQGDLFIDGEILPPDAPRPAPILVFDDSFHEVGEWFRFGKPELWTQAGGELGLDASAVVRGSFAGMLLLTKPLKDHYLAPDGEIVYGQVEVNDVILGCELEWGDPPAVVRVVLNEMGDTFEALIDPPLDGFASLRLVHHWAGGEALLDQARIAVERAGWHALRFANVDDHLELRLDGRTVLAAGYEANHFHPMDPNQRGLTLSDRALVGGEAGRLRLRRLRVWRDLYYTPGGEHATSEPLQLGPDEVFVLGDNSSESRDSRHFGPLGSNEVLGRPRAVVWPPGRVRLLVGAESDSR